jgi:site-specific DNA-cytosine methylase
MEQDFSTYEADLVLGGIPCEAVSMARNNRPALRETIEKWTALIERCLSIPEVVGARWWCYEDVVQIVRHLPILTPYFELDSKEFSGQRRKRAYVGNLPKPASLGDKRVLGNYLQPGPFRVSARLKGRVPCITHCYTDGKFYPWLAEKKAPTVIQLTSRHDNYAAIKWNGKWRQIDWKEEALLQGFPEDYLFIGCPGRVGKMIAQAVQIDTGRAILGTLCRELYTKEQETRGKDQGVKETADARTDAIVDAGL